VVEAKRTAFRCFGFTTVLRLGLELLRRGPALAPEASAEVHGLLGLAAHNRQFLSRRNRVLADFLEEHFRAALETEADPALRSCLCYRLAVTLGRRKGEPEAALEWAERALAAAAPPGLPPLPTLQAAHLQGWAHNIQAFALMRTGRLAEAKFRCQQAFALLDRALESFPEPASAATAPDQLVREAAFTHSLLADNLAALAKMEGDAEGLARWKEIADRLGEHFPGLARFEAATWIDLFRERRELRQALAHAEHGLEDARAEQDALREYEYEVQVADLHDRLGEAAEAFEAFERARDLRRRLGSPGFLRPLDAPAATAAARAGRAVEARGLYEGILGYGGLGPAARAQVLAALAELAARTNRPEEADARMNEAIALAVESGERDALLAVAVTAGRACRLLGREAEERDAFRRGVDIAAAGGPDAAPAPAGLSLAALLGAWETDGDPQFLRHALRLLPEALEDTSAWWELPRLLRAVRDAAPSGLLADPEMAGPLRDLEAAAGQRADCAALLKELQGLREAAGGDGAGSVTQS
jgi:tetratricopeptide (TPR) repeat protein